MNTIGDNLKKYRRKRGYTPRRLAEMVDIGVDILKDIEAGKRIPNPELVQELATALREPAHRLYSLPELRTPAQTIAKIVEDEEGEEVTVLFGGKRELDIVCMHEDGITSRLKRVPEDDRDD